MMSRTSTIFGDGLYNNSIVKLHKLGIWLIDCASHHWDLISNKMNGYTWIMPGWSRELFPGQEVPSCIVHPSSGVFWALATKALTLTLYSSYSLW